MATLIGTRSAVAVTSSWAVIWKQPSPSMAHTMRSGLPTLAPMAAGHGAVPLRPVGGDGGRFAQLRLDGGGDGLDGRPAVGGDADVGPADLADLGRVDVDVDDLGQGGEGGVLAGHPVVEPGAEGDEEVGPLHGGHGG